MPEFVPQHVPASLPPFVRGYLTAAEWLLDDDTDRDRLRGFTRAAICQATAECAAWQAAQADDLAAWCEATGRDDYSAGIDYWLSRTGSGSGYSDRDGAGAAGERLADAARDDGNRDTMVNRGRIEFFPPAASTQPECVA